MKISYNSLTLVYNIVMGVLFTGILLNDILFTHDYFFVFFFAWIWFSTVITLHLQERERRKEKLKKNKIKTN